MGDEKKQQQTAPLLQKDFHKNCPGCKVEQDKEKQREPPIKQLCFIWLVVLCATLPIASLFPFLYFMIRDFHIAESEEEIGYYAGFVGSSFMIGRGLTSVFWGLMADKYGRKPVIIMGASAVVIFNTLFGLSVNFWMAIGTRFLLGSLNGLIGPIKAYASEIFRKEYEALGISTVSTAWAIGLIIGPAFGGFLAQPAEKYPAIFPKDSIFGRFPYFLPCLCISLFALVVTVASFWLPETLHFHNKTSEEDSFEAMEPSISQTAPKKSLLKNWPLMSSILVFCTFSLHDMAYSEIFPLWAESPRRTGGLSYSTDDVGLVLVVSGIGLLVYQLSLYPALEKRLGSVVLTRISGLLSIPLLTCYPYLSMLSGFALSLLINSASVVKNILTETIVTGLLLLQNRAVDQDQRGAANGISMTVMSLFKAAGPAGGGAFFSWGQERQGAAFLPGNHMVFFSLNVIGLLGVLMTFRPFLVQRRD